MTIIKMMLVLGVVLSVVVLILAILNLIRAIEDNKVSDEEKIRRLMRELADAEITIHQTLKKCEQIIG